MMLGMSPLVLVSASAYSDLIAALSALRQDRHSYGTFIFYFCLIFSPKKKKLKKIHKIEMSKQTTTASFVKCLNCTYLQILIVK